MTIVRFIAGNALVQYGAIALFAFAAYKTHIYFERRDAVQDAREKARKIVTEKSIEDERRHTEFVEKIRKRTEKEIEEINSIEPHQCLDIRLTDIGLR